MIAFILKSTLSFCAVYFLYKVFLAKENFPVAKRYFLLCGMAFSMLVPLVSVPAGVFVPGTVQDVVTPAGVSPVEAFERGIVFAVHERPAGLPTVLGSAYALVAFVLLFRYVSNLKRLAGWRKKGYRVQAEGYEVVVVKQQIVPFSFLRTLFLSEKDYNGGAVRNEILFHELAHIRQGHSVDILLAELLQVVCWFNPVVWLYKKEIRLNHEYLADRQVIARGVGITDYQRFMLGFVSSSRLSCLSSYFNYSFIKKRFRMMTKEKSPVRTCIKAAVLIPVIVLLAVVLVINRQPKKETGMDLRAEWWQPILQKHGLQVSAFNNFGDVFEMGDRIAIDNGVATLTNPTILIKENNGGYMLIRAVVAEHDTANGQLSVQSGTMERYGTNTAVNEPLMSMEGDFKVNLKEAGE